MKSPLSFTFAAFTLLVAIFSLCPTRAAFAEPYVWIEAEDYTDCNFDHFERSNMGKPGLVSGEWIMKGMDPSAVKELVPDDGINITYKVQVPRKGLYNLWARVGWYTARAQFEWSIAGSPWKRVPKDMPTVNLMELGFFCEVSWANLGPVELEAGSTTLKVRYPKTSGENERMLVALDCFALVQGRFTPQGPLKPGETYDSEIDRKAAENVFRLPKSKGPNRTELELTGLWQVARYDDPNMDVDTYEPVPRIPAPDEYALRWMAFEVPGSPWNSLPLVFGHRLIYRTKIDVPASHRGRGFKLHFSGTNWIVSVFVNGKLAGTHTGVWVPWDLDVSEFVEPGKTNELAIAVKGTYYAMDAKSMGGDKSLNSHRNRPLDRKKWTRWVAPMYPSTKGDGDGYQYGIVNPVTLVSTGPAYTEDVFIRPSVRNEQLTAEVTVRNSTEKDRRIEVACEVVNDRTGRVEKAMPPAEITVPAGLSGKKTLTAQWSNAKLWWPVPNPDLYLLRTTISEDGKTLDIHEELFGFREVRIEGAGIYINGVRRNFWNWVDVHANLIEKPWDWAEALHQDGSRFMRFSHGRRIRQVLKTREDRLEFYDRNGIPGRLCTMIDGMFITFNLGERTRDKDNNPLLIVNEPVWKNFRQHMAQVAKAYRNHPSVIFYQVENELVYINGMNIYGGYLDRVEELMSQVCEAGRKLDSTRPYTVGGGGDLSGRLEINCPHYPHTAMDYYPENAYTLDNYSTKIERWPWDRKKPWVAGESCFANELEFGAYVLGDDVFRGIDDARRGKAKFLRMLYGGYRAAGVAGFFPWDNLWNFEDAQKVFSDLYAVPMKQTSRLFSAKENRLKFKIMNDTLSSDPVTVESSYEINGRIISRDKKTLKIEPGFGREYSMVVKAPKTAKRLKGTLRIKLSQSNTGQEYEDLRPVPVLPAAGRFEPGAKLYVFDPKGSLSGFLEANSTVFTNLKSLDAIKGKTGLLLIGADALTPAQAFGTDLLAFAAGGGRIIALEQQYPLAGAAVPVPLKTTQRFGGYAHPKALGTPIFGDLGKEDLIDWAAGHPTYANVYEKPSGGGRSLAEAGGDLEFSPLIEVPCGSGVMVLSQLRVAANLGVDPAADILLRNLVNVYSDYKPASGILAVFAPGNELLADKIQSTGALTETVQSVEDALKSKYKVALIEASEKNLRELLDSRERVSAFQNAGGWLMLAGLSPEGLDEFNRLTQEDFQIRPFRVERVTLENPQYKLAATLGNRDIALLSPREIMHGRYWVSSNTFSYCIDNRNFAPFTRPPGGPENPLEYKPTFDDHDPFNFVNGMYSSDFWRYIRQIWVPEEGPEPMTFELRKPDVLDTVQIWNNEIYWTIEDIDIIIDGDAENAIRATLPDSRDMTEIKLPKPVKVEKTITLQPRTWRERPIKRDDVRLVGIDNVRFLRPESREDAVFIDNVGGLVAFPKGSGGIFLCQLKFMAEEPRPENAGNKLRILGTILQNMGVGSRSASAIAVPGVNVRFTPLSIQEYCNAYLDDKSGKSGWFGRKGRNLANLPRGRGEFAGVDYRVVDYRTAPIPDCIILGGDRAHPSAVRDKDQQISGIKVGKEADVLYFLHTAFVARPVTERERERMLDRKRPFVLPTVMKYVLHYSDDRTAEIPVTLEKQIDHWLVEDAKPLENARIGWSRPVEAAEGKRAVLYSTQVANPRPDAEIESIEVLRTDNRATPAIIAITLGEIIKDN